MNKRESITMEEFVLIISPTIHAKCHSRSIPSLELPCNLIYSKRASLRSKHSFKDNQLSNYWE